MSYLKRQKMPKNWPIERKGTTYVVKPNFNAKMGLPVLLVLRNVLGLAQTRKDVKKIIHAKQVLVNEKPVRDEKNNVLLFDTINVLPTEKVYRMGLSQSGKFELEEIKKKDAEKKITKIVNKKTMKDKKTQLNLSDGTNFLTDIKCEVKDSAIVNLKDRKIETILPLKEKAKVIVFEGKHAGGRGIINNLKEKTAEIKMKDKTVEILIKQLMVIE